RQASRAFEGLDRESFIRMNQRRRSKSTADPSDLAVFALPTDSEPIPRALNFAPESSLAREQATIPTDRPWGRPGNGRKIRMLGIQYDIPVDSGYRRGHHQRKAAQARKPCHAEGFRDRRSRTLPSDVDRRIEAFNARIAHLDFDIDISSRHTAHAGIAQALQQSNGERSSTIERSLPRAVPSPRIERRATTIHDRQSAMCDAPNPHHVLDRQAECERVENLLDFAGAEIRHDVL